jgi:hypothetical protein
MKESRKEFIKKVHSAASNEWKENIEKEFPKLFKKDALVVGKWYKVLRSRRYAIIFNNGAENCYGFNYSNKWSIGFNLKNSINCNREITPATDKEVEEALIKEAKRRGFKEGVKFIDVNDGLEEIVDADN